MSTPKSSLARDCSSSAAEKEEAKTEEAAATKGEGEDGGADKKEGDEKDGEEKKEEKPLESLEEVLKNIPDVAPATGAGASVPRGKTKAPWGWKLDPDSTSGGFIRDSEQSEEHRPRKGMWCKIVDLTEAAHLNGRFCEITHLCEGEEREKTHCQIELDDDKFMIQQKNLNPLPGASERATFHMRWLPMVVLWVNGINCEGCKTSLIGALKGIEDVGDIRAESAVESTSSWFGPSPPIKIDSGTKLSLSRIYHKAPGFVAGAAAGVALGYKLG